MTVPDVLVLGGGIAGMSAAMELCEDHDLAILERRPIAGGEALRNAHSGLERLRSLIGERLS